MKDRSTLWKKILLDSVGLKEGSCVVVDGFREQLDELENLASECYIHGIYPILKLSLSYHSLEYLTEKNAPENLEARHLLALMDGIDAWITIFGWGTKKGEKRKTIRYPPEYQPSGEILQRMAEKKVKFVQVMFPPSEGHPLEDVVSKALQCDHNQIKTLGRKLKHALKDSQNVIIRSETGTDLHFSVKNRPIFVEDGVLDEEDLKEDFILTLPSGVVCFNPVENTVDGTAFIKKAKEYIFGTGDLEDVKLRFEQGHLVCWEAEKGSNLIEKFIQRTDGTGDMLCEICLGINEKVASYVGLPNIDELRYGAADIAIGDNRPFGKARTTPPVHWHFSLGKISLAVEGRTLIKNGEIV